MPTLTHPAPLVPRKRITFKKFRRGRPAPAQAQAARGADAAPPPASAYNRSALPLALFWFIIPAVLLVLSLAFDWSL